MKWFALLVTIAAAVQLTAGSATAASRADFYSYAQLYEEVRRLEVANPELLKVHELARTQEGRTVFALEVGRRETDKPAVMAVFAQHGDEHETTRLALGMVKRLLHEYGRDAAVTNALNKASAYLVPMANPDGADYDLSSDKTFGTWRKNRVNTGGKGCGVDLNRNWSEHWDAPLSKQEAVAVQDETKECYHGKKPFSENETTGISNFILNHKNTTVFADYHTGYSSFLQGDVVLPYCYSGEQTMEPVHAARHQRAGNELCALISDTADGRAAYAAMPPYKFRAYLLSKAPFLQRLVLAQTLPASMLAPGSSLDWAAARGMLSVGIEMACRSENGAVREAEREKMLQRQFQGFVFLLETAVQAKTETE